MAWEDWTHLVLVTYQSPESISNTRHFITDSCAWRASRCQHYTRPWVTLEGELSMQNHVNKVAQTCFYHILWLKQARKRKLHRSHAAAKLVASLVFSRLDYCNAILASLPRSTTAPLQQVQNAAACLGHITTTLKDRHGTHGYPSNSESCSLKCCIVYSCYHYTTSHWDSKNCNL